MLQREVDFLYRILRGEPVDGFEKPALIVLEGESKQPKNNWFSHVCNSAVYKRALFTVKDLQHIIEEGVTVMNENGEFDVQTAMEIVNVRH